VIELDRSRRNTEVDQAATKIGPGGKTELALNVADQLSGAETADLESGVPTETEASNIAIRAIRVGTLTDATLP
jgi:hypothetical protein